MCHTAIITCHDVYNYGASLQAYALQRFITDAGHVASIIDYKPDYLSSHFSLTAVNNPSWDYPVLRQLYLLAKLPGRLMARTRRAPYDDFTARFLNLTPERYTSVEELRAGDIKADILIAGSDQIWNTFRPNGHDKAFYLDFGGSRTIRVAYAPSFGSGLLAKGAEQTLPPLLARFDALSVREKSGLMLLKELGLPEAKHVCDPIFLLPADHWRELASQVTLPKLPERYILAYDMEGSSLLAEETKRRARSLGAKVISVGWHKVKGARHIRKAGPLEFIALIDGAVEVVSNSYHGILFARHLGVKTDLMMRTDCSNARMLDIMATPLDSMPAFIEESKNYLLSALSMRMRTVS